MTPTHVTLLENINKKAAHILEARGFHVDHLAYSPPLSELKKIVKQSQLIGLRSKTNITADILNESQGLSAIACFCIGTDQVDVEHAATMGIPVFNAPYGNTRSVAELMIGEIIMLLRRIPEKDRTVHRGGWLKTARGSHEVRGKTLGIVGYGHIGSQLSILAEGIGMNVIFYDTAERLALGNARAVVSLETLLKESDIVTLHVPDSPETRNMIDHHELELMSKGSYLLNASRGSVVNLEALAAKIESGHISGAAVDVYPEEPSAINDPFVTPLQGLDNVILTPHIGGSTQEAQENIAVDAANKLARFVTTGSTLGSVNLPEIDPGILGEEAVRIVHIHDNRPGMLSAINNAVADIGGNVVAQSLKTKGSIGLVVTDIEGLRRGKFKKLHRGLATLEGTIREIVIEG